MFWSCVDVVVKTPTTQRIKKVFHFSVTMLFENQKVYKILVRSIIGKCYCVWWRRGSSFTSVFSRESSHQGRQVTCSSNPTVLCANFKFAGNLNAV